MKRKGLLAALVLILAAGLGLWILSQFGAGMPPSRPMAGSPKTEEVEDVLLLYDSQQPANFDTNFCSVATYYGLRCRKLALDNVELTDALLRNARGGYFALAGVSPSVLNGKEPLLNGGQLATLKSAVAGGLNLLVSVQQPAPDSAALAQLTDGAILGANKLRASRSDWLIAATAPGPTRLFAGLSTACPTRVQSDLALNLAGPPGDSLLLTAADDTGARFPVVAQAKAGSGSVFVDGGEQTNVLESSSLASMYYSPCHFSEIVPLMLIIRHVFGERVWHSEEYYANFAIDDAALTEPFYELSYSALLEHMQAHNFHTTIAFIPANYQKSQPSVVNLFLANPGRFSLVQHGNNHDGYEFYEYSVSADDSLDGQQYAARPLAGQEQNILQGLARMGHHQLLTGIPFDRIMIFPNGISPAPTLTLLKKYNYLATMAVEEVPLDAIPSSAWDFGMYPANVAYEDFPILLRRSAESDKPNAATVRTIVLDLFLGKPVQFYTHPYAGALFDRGPGAFDDMADRVNHLGVPVQWQSLGNIVRQLYLEKTNHDGSVDVRMYTNDVIISTAQHSGATYHITKPETLNVPIKQLTVNNEVFPYRIEQNVLLLDVVAPQDGAPLEVAIQYGF